VKPNKIQDRVRFFIGFLRSGAGNAGLRPGPVFAVVATFLLALVAAFFGPRLAEGKEAKKAEFEVGRIAERDVMAERTVSFVDEEATRIRREAQERLVPANFRYSSEATLESIESFERFSEFSQALFEQKVSFDAYWLAVQAEYPGIFPRRTMESLFRNSARGRILDSAGSALRVVLDGGICSLPDSGLDGFNPDAIELVRVSSGRVQRERILFRSVPTLDKADARIRSVVSAGPYPSSLEALAPALLRPFISENVFFSAEDSALRLEEARSRVQSVMKSVERGERIIRKGFIVSKEDLQKLQALGVAASPFAPARFLGIALLLALFCVLTVFLSGPRFVGRVLRSEEIYLVAAVAAAYLLGAAFANGMHRPVDAFPSAVFLPTAMLSMLLAILLGPRAAFVFVLALPAAAFASGSFDTPSFIFAVIAGSSGALALQGAEKRMDLVRAGAMVAFAQTVAAAGVLLTGNVPAEEYLAVLFWAAFNGFACGMAVLGLLPVFEHALNAATPFRLIELSDLNSAVLKRLLTAAPGTYSHSVTVANLAESAAREIGANSLITRVGAYYHDIGKMDQPDYFVENQAAYNRHDEIQPRLSATVIKSHVKAGIEKAVKLGLPKEVVEIIAEHHGNSVISWFYNEAMKREDQVNADDFSYPGRPPHSRESAVVMLADTVEAAVRTLKKPTVSRLDKFVQGLIMAKFDQGQLSESDLTFRDLETIKNSFVRVLAGHYHSRIEYPKAREAVR